MKKLGLVFIGLAILIGLILPWAQIKFKGNEIGTLVFFDFRGDGIKTQTLLIRKKDNPIRISFNAKYKVGGLLPPVKIPITAKIADRNGTLIATIISFSTKGIDTGSEQPKVRGGNGLVFNVQQDGLHALNLAFAANANDGNIKRPDVEEISAKFIANAGAVNNSFTIPATILGVLGFYLLIRSRRQRKDDQPTKQRWGRGG